MSAILQTGAFANDNFKFDDWTRKGLPERTCEELDQCEMPAPPSKEERSTEHQVFLIAVPMFFLIGIIVLISILLIKARKSKLKDNSNDDLNDRGGIRNPWDDSVELSVNDINVGGVQFEAGGLIEGP